MKERNADNPGKKTGHRSRLLAVILLLTVFIAGVLLGRSWLSVSEQGVPPQLTEQNVATAEEAKFPSNRIKLSSDTLKLGQIEIGEAVMRSFGQTLEVTGRLAINEDNIARVGTFVTGRITRVLATVGDFVKKGQSLIYLHSHELLDARAAVSKAQAIVTEKEKALAYAKAEFERAERLLVAKAISKREHAQAAVKVAAATAELEQSRSEITRASEFLEHLTVPHDRQDDIVIYAPIYGVVLKRNVTLGTVVSEASDLMVIANLDTLWAVAEVPEQQAAPVRAGQSVELKVPAFGDRRFAARVAHIGETLNPDTRTVQVRCLVNNTRGNLRPEMYAKINISGGVAQPVVAAPREAVQDVQGEHLVFLALGDGVFEKRLVQIGREQDGMVEIIGGLQPGERIATRGGFFIKSEFLKSTLSKE